MLELSEQTKEKSGRSRPNGHYDKEFITEVVNAVNEGMAPRVAMECYGIARGTLSGWMKKYGSESWRQRRKLPIAGSIKRKVVRAVEQGKMSIEEARIAYNIRCGSTIRRWKKEMKAENAELVAPNSSVMKDKPRENKAVSSDKPADMKALQQALWEAELKVAALNTLIDVAEEQLKINIRKKPGAKQ